MVREARGSMKKKKPCKCDEPPNGDVANSFVKLVLNMPTVEQYLQLKLEQRDWRGVADAAMDLREMEAQLKVYKEILDSNEHA